MGPIIMTLKYLAFSSLGEAEMPGAGSANKRCVSYFFEDGFQNEGKHENEEEEEEEEGKKRVRERKGRKKSRRRARRRRVSSRLVSS